MTALAIFFAIFNLFMFFIWKTDTWLNVFMKFAMLIETVFLVLFVSGIKIVLE